VSTRISRDDAIGQDPLPKHLADATIAFDNDDQRDEEPGATEEVGVKGGHERLLIQEHHEDRWVYRAEFGFPRPDYGMDCLLSWIPANV
jgi:hypothetical protein